MTTRTEQAIKDRGDDIMAAARLLIGLVRISERLEKIRAERGELEIDVGLTGGGTETWTITIERTA